MIDFLSSPSNNNNSNSRSNSHEESYSVGRVSVTFPTCVPVEKLYSVSCSNTDVARRQFRHDVAATSLFGLTLLLALASRSNHAIAFTLTPPLGARSVMSPARNRKALLSTRESSFTESTSSALESPLNNDELSMMAQPLPTYLFSDIQSKQPIPSSQQPSRVAAGLFAPSVILLLALPSLSAVASTSLVQEAVDNLAYAILPESTPDLVSVVLGEGMGYATYFLFTAAAITSFVSFDHRQRQGETPMVVERDGDVSLFAFEEVEDHCMSFSPVDGGLEEDALVPCAFNVVEQALPLAPERNDSMSQHQSLLHHLDWVEVFFDITKWLSYFVLQSDLGGTFSFDSGMHPMPHLVESAIFGFVAGFGAKFYADILYRHFGQGPEQKRNEMTRSDWPSLCLLEAASAASLFTVYEAVQAPAQEWIQWLTNEVMTTAVASHGLLGM